MNVQLRLRFKPEPGKGAALPPLDQEQRAALRALPTDIVRGVASLFQQPAPRVTQPDVWPVIVEDALYLAATGWAGDALALGWHPLEIFGCASAAEGDDGRLGLAGRLNGRDVARITDQALLLRDGSRSSLLRRNLSFDDTTYLWNYGR